MSEVDELILLQLKGIEVDLGSAKGVTDFDAALFYKSAFKCCELISRELIQGKPESLPTGMSQRFKATSDLASAVISAGYGGELTFNQFMYPTPGDMRSVLSWLCQNLPSRDHGTAQKGDAGLGGADLAAHSWEMLENHQRLFERHQADRESVYKFVWPPLRGEYAKPPARQTAYYTTLHPFATPMSDAEADWCSRNLQFTSRQVYDRCDLYTSVLAYNGITVAKEKQEELEWETTGKHTGLSKKEYKKKKKETMSAKLTASSACTARYEGKFSTLDKDSSAEPLVKGTKSRFMKEKEFGTEAMANETELTESEETQLAAAQTQHELQKEQKKNEEKAIKKQLKQTTETIQKLMEEAVEAEEELKRLKQLKESDAGKIIELTEDGDALEEMFNVYQSALELCDDPDNNNKLQEKMDSATTEYDTLEQEWKAKEKKMKVKYELLKAEFEKANSKLQALYDEIDENKLKMKELRVSSKKKEEQIVQMQTELEKLPKDVDREHYLQRIMDIIKNIGKQQDEVEKITDQSKETIVTIAELEEGLTKAFQVVDEKCYNEVKQDAANKHGRAVYRQLIALREAFDGLISGVEQQGVIKQSTYEYEEKIDKQKNRNEGLNTEQVNADLENIRAENEAAAARLKELRGQLKALA
eukprot:TRINITY_DN9244_c2_g1_i1.p1 TRINITY_DN9244_c2_g1~~TRINITY_DN9244_c2_g1_i1.p1  ORF type:complete len:659 (+),score=277.63 TRINITY_DN9244_c2_g1_i1:41-1978(+)